MRPLLAGSPKEKAAKKAWQGLIDLGIVEAVDPAKPNNWTTALHFPPKPGGEVRTVGDYRELNMKTELDLYPLPNLKAFSHKLHGSKVFSKVDVSHETVQEK